METGEIAGDVRFAAVAGVFEESGWVGWDRWLLELGSWIGGVVVEVYALEWEEAFQCSLEGCLKRLDRLRLRREASILYVVDIS